MTRALALPLLLAALPAVASAPAPPAAPEVVLVEDFASLPHGRALRLHGKRGLFRVTVDSPPTPLGRWHGYECEGRGAAYRTLWLHQDDEPDDGMVVEAVLVIHRHQERVTPTQRFEGFMEYRLAQARRQ
jgi:hypothetical protein